MKVIADFAGSLACPTPMFSAAVPLFNAAVASGCGAQDTAAVPAVIEAMAAGLPVVATRGGALPEVVVHGETGFLVDRGDTQGLNDAIATLLANPTLRARMGAAGRKRVEELFTWEQCVARLNELYSGVPIGSDQARLGISSPFTTAGRAKNAPRALVTCEKSPMPTRPPAS